MKFLVSSHAKEKHRRICSRLAQADDSRMLNAFFVQAILEITERINVFASMSEMVRWRSRWRCVASSKISWTRIFCCGCKEDGRPCEEGQLAVEVFCIPVDGCRFFIGMRSHWFAMRKDFSIVENRFGEVAILRLDLFSNIEDEPHDICVLDGVQGSFYALPFNNATGFGNCGFSTRPVFASLRYQ